MKHTIATRIALIESNTKRRILIALALLPFSIYYPIKLAVQHLWAIWRSAAIVWVSKLELPPIHEGQA